MDFNELCRACLLTVDGSNKIILFKDVSAYTYWFCTSIQILETEDLPKILCSSCYDLLSKFVAFKQKCLDAQQYLLNLKRYMKKDTENSVFYEIREKKNSDILTLGVSESRHLLQSEIKLEPSYEEFGGTYSNDAVENQNFENDMPHTKIDFTRKNDFLCDVCNKVYTNRKTFNNHKKIHEKRLCIPCNKSFKSKPAFYQHKKLKHSQFTFKETKCKKCGKVCKTVKTLHLHMKTKHSETNKYICDVCGKISNSRGNLKGHTDRLTTSQRRRLRRKTLKNIKNPSKTEQYIEKANLTEIYTLEQRCTINKPSLNLKNQSDKGDTEFEKLNNCVQSCKEDRNNIKMDTKSDVDAIQKARDEVKAAREAKKLAKQAKKKVCLSDNKTTDVLVDSKVSNKTIEPTTEYEKKMGKNSIDEVDRAEIGNMQDTLQLLNLLKTKLKNASPSDQNIGNVPVGDNLTVNDVVNTLKDIVNVAKDVENVTTIVQSMNIQKSGNEKGESDINKPVQKDRKPQLKIKHDFKGEEEKRIEGEGKSKAELKAERRAKQEAQRAAKLAQTQEKEQKPITKPKAAPEKAIEADIKKEKSPKLKTLEKPKKAPTTQKCNWFQHLHPEHDKEALKQVAINSNLHPAVIKLGVQLASRVVTGANARCIALLDALKKMVRDYILPAKTEFARGLEAQLAASLAFLWKMRAPSASQVNAIKHFRHQLTQLPNNVDEFDAKKKLQEEIDRYIREQIDMAGEAISIAVRNKISNGDNILTYGCSSLIERILRESHEAGVQYRAVIVGNRVSHSAREMLRRLVSAGVACTYVDISALSYVMKTINKVLLGANALLVNGSVLGAVGTLQVALVARAHNVPVLVACETHKFSDRVQTDAFVYNEIGDADALIDKSDDNSPLKDWRSNPNLTLLNLTYDVTPASLVTAVVTELAILPCTSAPVVLRFKTSEYGM